MEYEIITDDILDPIRSTGGAALANARASVGIDYQLLRRKYRVWHLQLLSYLKVLYDVKKKTNDVFEIDGKPYAILSISEIAVSINLKRRDLQRVLSMFQEDGYLDRKILFSKAYFFLPTYIPKTVNVSYKTPRLDISNLPGSLTTLDLHLLDCLYQVTEKRFSDNQGFYMINQTDLASRLRCSTKTISRRIKKLWLLDLLDQQIINIGEQKTIQLIKLNLNILNFHTLNLKSASKKSNGCVKSVRQKIYNTNTSYLYMHYQYTSYINNDFSLPISDRNRNKGGVDPSGLQNLCRKNEFRATGITLKLQSLMGVAMNKFAEMENKVRESHRSKANSMTQVVRLIRSYFPFEVKRASLLPMERAVLKQLLQVCKEEEILIEEYISTLHQFKDSLEGSNKYLKKAFAKSFILTLARPEVFDYIVPKLRPIGVIFPQKLLENGVNFADFQARVVYEDNHQEEVSIKVGYSIAKTTNKFKLSTYISLEGREKEANKLLIRKLSTRFDKEE